MDKNDSESEVKLHNAVTKLIAYVVVFLARVFVTALVLFLASKLSVSKGLLELVHIGGYNFAQYLAFSVLIHVLVTCFVHIEDGED